MIHIFGLFPYPYLDNVTHHGGLIYDWPDECTRVVEAIRSDKAVGVWKLDSVGFNYHRINPDVVCAGVGIDPMVVETD